MECGGLNTPRVSTYFVKLSHCRSEEFEENRQMQRTILIKTRTDLIKPPSIILTLKYYRLTFKKFML